ncbi:MAG TPA: hypothetical protein PLV68_21645, partial [Ilumatobacteraceae bacterium]|nr:hypothetical protein [Ilumatobacteraceae bacterium]
MTTPTSAPTSVTQPSHRARPRFVAILRYTLRSCLPLRRWAAILMPCAGAVLFGALSHAVERSAEDAFANIAAEAIFGLVKVREGEITLRG